MTEEIIKCVKGESCIHCDSIYCRFVDEVNELKQENDKLKCLLVEIYEIALVNAITTCWTVMDNCEKCTDKDECKTQSPLTKLELIQKRINEVLI